MKIVEFIKQWNNFSRIVSEGKKVPKNVFCYDLQKYAKLLYVWYNVEDFKKLSLVNRVIHVAFICSVGIHWGLIGVNICMIPVNLESIAFICKIGSMVLGGSLSVMRCVEGWRNREKITRFLKDINHKVQRAREVASEKRLKENLTLHVYLAWAVIVAIGALTAMYIMGLIYTIYTAEFEFEMALPVEMPPYSLAWWINILFSLLVMWYCAFLYTIFDGIYMDAIIQLAFLYQVEYDRLKTIRGSDAEVKRTLVSIFCELRELKA